MKYQVIRTARKRENVIEALNSMVRNDISEIKTNCRSDYYRGTVENSRFLLERYAEGKGSTNPLIDGEIVELDDGCIIKIEYKWSSSVGFLLNGMKVFAALFVAVFIMAVMINGMKVQLLIIIGFIPMTFIVLGAISAQHSERISSEQREFEKLLDGCESDT